VAQQVADGQDGRSCCRALRRLIVGTLTVFLVGCYPIAPSEVKISLNSDKVLGVKDFKFEPAGEYTGCQVSGTIEYDIKIEPANFTGSVELDKVVIEYAGKWRAEPQIFYLTFLEGKSVGGGIGIGQYASSDDSKDMKEAVCASKSSSDIKIASLGTGLVALPGIKAVVVDKK